MLVQVLLTLCISISFSIPGKYLLEVESDDGGSEFYKAEYEDEGNEEVDEPPMEEETEGQVEYGSDYGEGPQSYAKPAPPSYSTPPPYKPPTPPPYNPPPKSYVKLSHLKSYLILIILDSKRGVVHTDRVVKLDVKQCQVWTLHLNKNKGVCGWKGSAR